jgi:Divergent InlB B-repeat domain
MNTLTLRLLGCGLLCALGSSIRAEDNAGSYLKSIAIPNAAPETNPPAVFIQYPANGQRVGQSIIQTIITATDDTRVESFRFSANGATGDWYWAPSMQWPWGTSFQVSPGTNTFGVECADYWGNISSASVTFVSLPDSALMVDVSGGGQVTPNYQGEALDFGQKYSMTARPAKGFRFEGWSGSVSNKRRKLTFVMESNLVFNARFRDISRPVSLIRFPRSNRTVTDSTFIASGRAADNSAVTNVYYQLNDNGWEMASTTNGWTNWETAALSPVPGRNVLETFAVDDSGLLSRTNRVRFRY